MDDKACKKSQIAGGMNDMETMKPNPFLLALRDSVEADVVVNALVAFAVACEAEGDACGVAPVADRICARARALRQLGEAGVVEHLRAIGLGPTYRRPQG